MMLRRIARPMLAAWFVSEGVGAFRGAPSHVDPARAGVDVLVEKTGIDRPSDAQLRTIVKIHGAATAGAGLALALGKAPRVAALLLAVLTFPSVVVNLVGAQRGSVSAAVKKERQDRVIRAVSFTGAALIAAADREGRPGLAWKVSHARELAAAGAAATAAGAVRSGRKAVKHAGTSSDEKSGTAKAVKVAEAAAVAKAGKVAKGMRAGKETQAGKPPAADVAAPRPSRAARRADARAVKAAAAEATKAQKAAKVAAAAEARAAKVAGSRAARRADAKAAKVAAAEAATAQRAADVAAAAEAKAAAKAAKRSGSRASRRADARAAEVGAQADAVAGALAAEQAVAAERAATVAEAAEAVAAEVAPGGTDTETATQEGATRRGRRRR